MHGVVGSVIMLWECLRREHNLASIKSGRHECLSAEVLWSRKAIGLPAAPEVGS